MELELNDLSRIRVKLRRQRFDISTVFGSTLPEFDDQPQDIMGVKTLPMLHSNSYKSAELAECALLERLGLSQFDNLVIKVRRYLIERQSYRMKKEILGKAQKMNV